MSNSTVAASHLTVAQAWSQNSLSLSYAGGEHLCIFTMVFGCCVLLHSFHLNGKKLHAVRVCTDISSLTIVFQAACFYSCLVSDCTVADYSLRYNFFAAAIFSLSAQLCDNYMTFIRYDRIIHGTSSRHRMLAFLWVLFPLTLSWELFFTLFPLWFNQNSPEWVFWQLVFSSWLNFCCYLLYDFFYMWLLFRVLVQMRKDSKNVKGRSRVIRLTEEMAVRAICHTVFSVIGIFLYAFEQPLGILAQNLVITAGIHCCLNCRYDLSFLGKSHRRVYAATGLDDPQIDGDEVTPSSRSFSRFLPSAASSVSVPSGLAPTVSGTVSVSVSAEACSESQGARLVVSPISKGAEDGPPGVQENDVSPS